MVHWGTASCDPPTPTDEIDTYWRSTLVESAGWIGLARISEANVEEWLWRFEFLRRMGSKEAGCLVFNQRGKVTYEPIPLVALRRWIGLWTNWSDISRHAFVKRQYEELERACDRSVRDAVAALAPTPGHSGAKGKKKRRVKA